MEKEFFCRKKPALSWRGIHLDLKGLPPSPERLLQLVELAALAKGNCLLVEWEDMYPWKDTCLRNETAYGLKTIELFLKKARDWQIEIIPLVQSFGHLENLLSRKKFRSFREIPDNVSDLCPSKKGSSRLILGLVKDILTTHTGIKYFHLGADEVWSLGTCPVCQKKIAESGKATLYLAHLMPVFQFLNEKGIRPIIWDDMLRNWEISELKEISQVVDLMCWSYAASPFLHLHQEVLRKYVAAGCRLWAASAFKGADGAYADRPALPTRLANMAAWVETAQKLKMTGVIATGWSRYSTFVSPCESLEVSLDSLVLSWKIAWEGKIPDDAGGWAEDFLNYCQQKGVKTSHFSSCSKVAEQLQKSREDVFQAARKWLQQAHLAGEKERVNPYRTKELRKYLKENLRKVNQLAQSWQKLHQGLVPGFWLKRYRLSRILPLKHLLKILLEKRKKTV